MWAEMDKDCILILYHGSCPKIGQTNLSSSLAQACDDGMGLSFEWRSSIDGVMLLDIKLGSRQQPTSLQCW